MSQLEFSEQFEFKHSHKNISNASDSQEIFSLFFFSRWLPCTLWPRWRCGYSLLVDVRHQGAGSGEIVAAVPMSLPHIVGGAVMLV